jgi:hypothetical protein
MNCAIVQNRLLSCDRPDLPPVDVKGHLVECPVCRAWHRRLVRMEQQLVELPVPPSLTKQAFLRGLVAEPPAAEPPAVAPQIVLLRPQGPAPKERALQKVAVAFALAAAMLLFSVGWWAWHYTPGASRGSVAALQQYREELGRRLDERLARAGTPKRGVEAMDELAEVLQREAQELARGDERERLAELSRFYAQVVREQLLPFARQLPAGDRTDVLNPVVRRLAAAESELERLAAERAAHAEPLRAIAAAAHETARDLEVLAAG